MYNDVFNYSLHVVLLCANICLQSSLILIWFKPM